MVRAAATGAFNYAKADPYNPQWRLRHTLILREVARQADERVLAAVHDHWLTYVGHSRLEDNSWQNAKKQAADMLQKLRTVIYPGLADNETSDKKATIDDEYADLIASYRAMVAGKKQKDVNKAQPQ